MRGFGGSTLRGGQTVFHSIRMWGQLFQAAMLFAAFMTVAVPAWNLWNRTTGAEWYAAGMFTLAEFKLTVGYAPDSGQEIRFADGTTGVMKIRDIVASMPAWRARERIKAEMFRSAWLGAKVGAGIIALFLGWFWYRGVQLSRRKRIRGAELVTAGELRRRMRPAHLRVLDRMPGAARLRPYSIAGIPYPERTETQHTIVSGTTGSGKTVLIADLVSQIRARGERCVIYDKMGSYTRSFFLEARNPRDFDMMAAALIPQRSRARRADEPARCAGAALVALPGGPQPARLRHDGGRADPAAEGHGGPVLGDGGAAAVLQRRRRVLEKGRHREQGPGRPSAQDRPDGTGQGHGRHGRAVDRRSGEPEDRALGARHADGPPRGAGVPARYRQAVFDSGLDRQGGQGRFPVPDLARRPACEPARPDLDLARDRGQRDGDAGPGRRPAHLGHPRRAADPAPGAVIAAGACRIAPVRRLLRARRSGRRGAARPLREERGRDHLRSLRHRAAPAAGPCAGQERGRYRARHRRHGPDVP